MSHTANDDELKEEVAVVQGTDEASPEPVTHGSFEKLNILISNSENRKTPGRDSIRNIAVKRMPQKAKVKLLNILNAFLKFNYFPS